jgi:hypothetical protein
MSNTASNSLALPALRTYAVAVALAEAYLALVRAATAPSGRNARREPW